RSRAPVRSERLRGPSARGRPKLSAGTTIGAAGELKPDSVVPARHDGTHERPTRLASSPARAARAGPRWHAAPTLRLHSLPPHVLDRLPAALPHDLPRPPAAAGRAALGTQQLRCWHPQCAGRVVAAAAIAAHRR